MTRNSLIAGLVVQGILMVASSPLRGDPNTCEQSPPDGYIQYGDGADVRNHAEESSCSSPSDYAPYRIYDPDGLDCGDPNVTIQTGDQLVLLDGSGATTDVLYLIVAVDPNAQYALLDHDPGDTAATFDVHYLIYEAGTLTLEDLEGLGSWDLPCDPNDPNDDYDEIWYDPTCRVPAPQGPLGRWLTFTDVSLRAGFSQIASGSALVAVADRALGRLQQMTWTPARAAGDVLSGPSVSHSNGVPDRRLSWASVVFRLIGELLLRFA